MTIQIRNRNCVALVGQHGDKLVAVRVSTEHDWEIFTPAMGNKLVAIVKTEIPEVLQRKLILAILKEFE